MSRHCWGRLPALRFRLAVKSSPRGGCYGQRRPCFAVWVQPGPPGAAGAEPQPGSRGAGRDPSQPPSGSAQPGASPSRACCRHKPEPAVPEPPVCASALLHDGNHPPRPSLPSSPVQDQAPFHVSQGARINTGQLKRGGGCGNSSIPILVSTSGTRCPCRPATCAKDALATKRATCWLGHQPCFQGETSLHHLVKYLLCKPEGTVPGCAGGEA